ncbi:hypothetical protein PG994_014819 [Apiospora phragmitis]|uniref:Uncharacterized protein n=1 Tax=Apiospora phragmitis TaxID=2905665 RepID=A0ABR1SUQ2_9PEZI
MFLIIALLGLLLSMVSAADDRLIVYPDCLADYEYFLKVENHTISAVLANGTVIHDNADPCTSRTNYKMYHEYLEADCKAPVDYMESIPGFCDVTKGVDTIQPCVSFCQVRTTHLYDKEVPWEKSYCGTGANVICSVASGTYMNYESDHSYPGMEDVYIRGISGGWLSGSGGVWAAPNLRYYLIPRECGYWTFIPIQKMTCGSTSWAISGQDLNEHKCHYDKIWESITTEHDCVVQNIQSATGGVAGVSVFVQVNCGDLTVAPANRQNDAYLCADKLSPQDLDKKLQSWM